MVLAQHCEDCRPSASSFVDNRRHLALLRFDEARLALAHSARPALWSFWYLGRTGDSKKAPAFRWGFRRASKKRLAVLTALLLSTLAALATLLAALTRLLTRLLVGLLTRLARLVVTWLARIVVLVHSTHSFTS